MLIRALIVATAVAIVVVWYLTLPPAAPDMAVDADAATVRGAIHVHTARSDGTGTVDEVAAAASRAGIDFIVFTDHGDASTEPEAPRYRSGVLCIDGVEISSQGGHVLAIGLPKAPYPLGGEARDVLEDIRRLGGFAIAAHPGSNKPELQWTDWSQPIDGLEWVNADSEWRDESTWTLIRALLAYPIRPTASITSLLDRPTAVLQRWDEALRDRRVVAIAGSDAHARLGLRTIGEPYDNGSSLHIPAYERVFRMFSNVLPDTGLTGNAQQDADRVIAAIRDGRLYSRIEALNPAGTLTFVQQENRLTATVAAAPDARISLLRDGREVAAGTPERPLDYAAPTTGVYRVEVHVDGAPGTPPVPWIVSNPVYVGREGQADPRPPPARPVTATETQYTDGAADRWTVETSSASRAAFDVTKTMAGTNIAFRYALGGSTGDSAYAALAMASGASLRNFDRLVFTANADRPMRLSVQLRAPGGADGERWQRSVYLDDRPREITVYFDDLRPAGPTRTERPPLDAIDSILFVVDTVNTALGSNGRVWIDDVKYAR